MFNLIENSDRNWPFFWKKDIFNTKITCLCIENDASESKANICVRNCLFYVNNDHFHIKMEGLIQSIGISNRNKSHCHHCLTFFMYNKNDLSTEHKIEQFGVLFSNEKFWSTCSRVFSKYRISIFLKIFEKFEF